MVTEAYQRSKIDNAVESNTIMLSKAEYYLIEKAAKFEQLLGSKVSSQSQRLLRTETSNNFGLLILRADSPLLLGLAIALLDALPVLEQVMRMMSLVAQERGVELTYHAEGACFVLGTKDEIYQVIYNIFDNAVKYVNSFLISV